MGQGDHLSPEPPWRRKKDPVRERHNVRGQDRWARSRSRGRNRGYVEDRRQGMSSWGDDRRHRGNDRPGDGRRRGSVMSRLDQFLRRYPVNDKAYSILENADEELKEEFIEH